MSEKHASAGHDRPFPWRCTKCKAKAVYPQATDYTVTVKHDGRPYTIRIPDLSIPTCRNCGEQTFAVGDDDRIVAGLRAQIGLLAPEEIRESRCRLGLNQQELAEQLGVAKETISRWETGALIQSRAMDNLLRLFFGSEEVRRLLRQRFVEAPRNRVAFARARREDYVEIAVSSYVDFRMN
jgi:putative zinc finger/helix-turn-helix YgiT family protein